MKDHSPQKEKGRNLVWIILGKKKCFDTLLDNDYGWIYNK